MPMVETENVTENVLSIKGKLQESDKKVKGRQFTYRHVERKVNKHNFLIKDSISKTL